MISTWVGVVLQLAVAVAVGALECPEGCTKFGNCNTQEGKCKCPFGRGGDACEIDMAPACKIATNSPTHCSDFYPKACDCMKQCVMLQAPHANSKLCFERTSLPMDQQNSSYPEEDEEDVVFYRGQGHNRALTIPREEAKKISPTEFAYALSKCPDRCNGRGHCRTYVKPNGSESEHVCMCLYGYGGKSCEIQRPDACFNGCSGNGNCTLGFCHCKPGFYGINCKQCGTRKGGETSEGGTMREGYRPPLKVFVYDLPEVVGHASETIRPTWYQYHDGIYVAYRRFTWRLLDDCAVRTDDPEEADLFYVNEFTYGRTSNTGSPRTHLVRTVEYIKSHYPYWNRNGGRDHILWVAGDQGGCDLRGEMRNSILVTHYGAMPSARELRGGRHMYARCHRMIGDIVAPPNIGPFTAWFQEAHRGWRLPTEEEERSGADLAPMMPGAGGGTAKKNFFFFAGGLLLANPRYSGGVRQDVYHMHASKPGFLVAERVPNYHHEASNSVFCLAPSGHGWGIRIVQMVAAGCVPVIIQDHVLQPFEGGVLPYWKFSVRMTKEEIPRLEQKLRGFSEAEVRRMQMDLFRYGQGFNWDTVKGGLAYQTLLFALQRKLDRIHGVNTTSGGAGAMVGWAKALMDAAPVSYLGEGMW